MLLRALISFFSLGLVTSSTFPEVASYAKVSRNGQVSRGDSGGRSFSSISSTPSRGNASSTVNEGRNFQDIDITVSPIYIPPKIPKLKNGEAVDFPVTRRYSTIDEGTLTKLESARKKPEIQARFHPPASFEHSVANANAVRQQQQQQQQKPQTINNVVPDTPKYPGPIYSGFNYKVPGFHSSEESDFSDKPISKPISIDEYESSNVRTKPADPYKTVSTNYGYAEFGPEPAGPAGEASPKPIYSDHEDQLALVDGPYLDHDFHGDHDLIYEHVPEYPEYHHHHHHHQQHQQTTEMPEMNDQRLDKRPYSYYFIGKKLWYVPLYFSIYFIIYIAALVLKSVARHKINFPANLAEAAHARSSADDLGWWEFTGRILQGIESFAERLARDS